MTYSIIKKSQLEDRKYLDSIFPKKWIDQRPELRYALSENQEYRVEVNKWLEFFDSKGWLTKNLIKRLQTANSWASFYSKINELRAGYFLETELGIKLNKYEANSTGEKNVEFKGTINDDEVYFEVKTPLNLNNRNFRCGSFNGSGKIIDCLNKANEQFSGSSLNIVVLSDDLKVPLSFDLLAQNTIWRLLNCGSYPKISTVLIVGNIYHEAMYRMRWAMNPNATFSLERGLFNNYEKIKKL